MRKASPLPPMPGPPPSSGQMRMMLPGFPGNLAGAHVVKRIAPRRRRRELSKAAKIPVVASLEQELDANIRYPLYELRRDDSGAASGKQPGQPGKG